MWRIFVFFWLLNYYYCKADIKDDGDFYYISCGYNETMHDLKRLEKATASSIILINTCPNPNDTYKNILEKLNFIVSEVKNLEIEFDEPREFFDWQFEDLVPGTEVELKLSDAFTYKFEAKGFGETLISNGTSITISCFPNEQKIHDTFIHGLILNAPILTIYCIENLNESTSVFKLLDDANIKLENATVTIETIKPEPYYLTAELIKNISIETLNVRTDFIYEIVVDVDVFVQNLLTLKEIDFRTVNMPSLPENNVIKKVVLSDGFSRTEFGYCNELKSLELFEWTLFNNDYLQSCTKIEDLFLHYLGKEDVTNLVKGKVSLKRLVLNDCELNYLPSDFLSDASKLIYLDLSDNDLKKIDAVAALLVTHKEFQTLILNDNPSLDFCSTHINPTSPLAELSLTNTGLTKLCFGSFRSLQLLNLSNSYVSQFDITELPSSNAHEIVVDLRGNPLNIQRKKDICMEGTSESPEYEGQQQKNVTVVTSWLMRCDCDEGCLWSGLQRRPWLRLDGAVCPDGRPFHSQDADHVQNLQCTKDPLDCSPCECREYWRNHTIEVDCRALGYSHILDNLTALLVTQLPSYVTEQHIDLRDNGILSVSEEASEALFSVATRRIYMAGTSPVCGCDNNRLLLQELQDHKYAILDYDNITTTCFGEDIFLKELDLEELCGVEYWAFITPISLLASFSIAIYFVYSKYKKQIKVYLFARGYCLSCLQEEEALIEKDFDAFISFCHEDDDFVHENIIPNLSEYKLCIHYRDWLAGDWIPAQIARSIDQSMRTLVVMSKNFLSSKWGLMEFRMAHASTVETNRAKVIVVLLDNVFELPELDAELRSYLAMNTYVKWGDPWFFEKLKLALPRRKRDEDTVEITEELKMASNTYRREDSRTNDDGETNTRSTIILCESD